MKQVSHLLVLTGTLALAACASSGGPPAPAPIARANPADATASDTTHKAYHGYTRKVINGQEKFCRNDTYTGSRVQKDEVCLTAAELDRQGQDTQDFMQDIQRRGGTTTTTNTPGSMGPLGGGK